MLNPDRRTINFHSLEIAGSAKNITAPSFPDLPALADVIKNNISRIKGAPSICSTRNESRAYLKDIAVTSNHIILLINLSDRNKTGAVLTQVESSGVVSDRQEYVKTAAQGWEVSCHVLVAAKGSGPYPLVMEKVPGITSNTVQVILNKIFVICARIDPRKFTFPHPAQKEKTYRSRTFANVEDQLAGSIASMAEIISKFEIHLSRLVATVDGPVKKEVDRKVMKIEFDSIDKKRWLSISNFTKSRGKNYDSFRILGVDGQGRNFDVEGDIDEITNIQNLMLKRTVIDGFNPPLSLSSVEKIDYNIANKIVPHCRK